MLQSLRNGLLFLALAYAPMMVRAGNLTPAVIPSADAARVDAVLQRLSAVHAFNAVALSPDGRMLAWVIATANGTRLYFATAQGTNAREVTVPGLHQGCDFDNPAFSPDGSRLAFLSDCSVDRKQPQDNVFVLEIDRAGVQARQVTRLKGLVHALRWTPDGRKLAFLYVPGDTHRVDALAATKPRVGVIGEANIEHQRVAMVPANGGTPALLTPPTLFPYEFDVSPHARRIAFVAAPPPGDDNWWVSQLYVQDIRSHAPPRAVVNPNVIRGPLHGMQLALPRFSPDGRSIAFIGGLMSDQGVTGGDIYLIHASGGTPTNLTPYSTVTPGWLAWSGPDSLLVNAFAGGSSQLASLTITNDARGIRVTGWHPLATVHAALEDGSAMSALAYARHGTMLAFIQSTFAVPPEVWTATFTQNRGGMIANIGTMRPVTRVNAGVQPLWGRAVSVHWHNQGFSVQGWLLYPADYDPHKKYPLVVAVHGGPSYAVQPRWPGVDYGGAPLSAMGYFVLFPNPRGSFGQGEKYTEANRRDFGYGDLRDILAGIRTVEHRYPVDPNRIGITGWSYGGFMSMFAPTQTSVFRAAVAGAGLSDWLSYTGENSIDQWMTPFFGATVYDDPAAYARSSAINYIKHDRTPTLLLVGEYDAECPAPQSFEMWHGLKAMGVPTQLVVYPDEGHGFVDPAHKRDVLVRALAWFARYLPPSATSLAGPHGKQ